MWIVDRFRGDRIISNLDDLEQIYTSQFEKSMKILSKTDKSDAAHEHDETGDVEGMETLHIFQLLII
jgi:hypothetical protein